MVDIVIPAYNEGGNIGALFEKVSSEIKCEKRLMIVYDFDEDNTLPVINSIKDKYSFSINTVKNAYGRGALNAIKTGLYAADSEAVLVIMADLSDSLEIVDKMYSLIHDEKYDLVCGSRYMKGGKQHGGPFLKGLFSRSAGVSLNLLSGIPTHDISNSFKMYRRSLLDEITVESTGGFEIGMEITIKSFIKGFKIVEIPSQWYDRTAGESNFKMWRWMPLYLHWYFYCIKNTWFGGRKIQN